MGATHPEEGGHAGRPRSQGPLPPAGRGLSHPHPAWGPRAAGWQDGPQYLSLSAQWLPSSSASHAHMSYERRTASLGSCPLPHRPAWSLKLRTAPAQGFAAKAPNPTKALQDTHEGVGRQPDGVQRAGPAPGAGPVAPTVGPTLRTPSGAYLQVCLYRGPEGWLGTSPQEAALCFRILRGGTGGRWPPLARGGGGRRQPGTHPAGPYHTMPLSCSTSPGTTTEPRK